MQKSIPQHFSMIGPANSEILNKIQLFQICILKLRFATLLDKRFASLREPTPNLQSLVLTTGPSLSRLQNTNGTSTPIKSVENQGSAFTGTQPMDPQNLKPKTFPLMQRSTPQHFSMIGPHNSESISQEPLFQICILSFTSLRFWINASLCETTRNEPRLVATTGPSLSRLQNTN